ncbi:MAG TPA: FecR family protein [Vicinamibacterales bacterium]|nr:FecR family protein [Vicinamibacterales bacterium]
MNNNHDSEQRSVTQADQIGQLLKLAGRRPVPDAAQMSHAHAAARLQWIRVIDRRRPRMAFWSLIAAMIAVTVFATVGWFALRDPALPSARPEIAAIEAVIGPQVVVDGSGGSRSVTAPGPRVRAGDRIETGSASRSALRMLGRVSVRLDSKTSAVLESETRMILQRGAAYVDVEPGGSGAALHIATSFGVIRHTGTQFEVRLDGAALQVRVREGSVAVEASTETWTAQAGELLVVAPGRSPERRSIATSGAEWSWVSDVAPPFRLEGSTVPAFLHWVTREQGWKLEFGDSSLRARVDGIVLHGSIAGLTPEEALAAVLPTCGLASRRESDRLIVGVAQ